MVLMPFSAGGAMREIVPAIKALWQGDYVGEGQSIGLSQKQQAHLNLNKLPHPPIWIAARDQSSHDFALEQGCNVQVTPLWLGDEEVTFTNGKI